MQCHKVKRTYNFYVDYQNRDNKKDSQVNLYHTKQIKMYGKNKK